MKRVILLLMCICMMFGTVTAKASLELYYDGEYHTYNGSIYSLYINGQRINTPMEPIIFNNRALVPLREVFEALGATVSYNNQTKGIVVEGLGKKIEMQINSSIAIINNVVGTIPDGITPKLITKAGGETKTMVPARFISESIGLNVEFDASMGAIKISSPMTGMGVIQAPIVSTNDSKTAIITINMTSPLQTLKTAVTSSGVLYFDAAGFTYSGASKTTVTHAAVKSVRFGSHDGYTRVAVDMQNYAGYNVLQSADKKTVTITVTAKDGAQTPVTPPANTTVDTSKITVDVNKLKNYSPSNGYKIVILDAGHGGSDPGAQGTDSSGVKRNEKDITLAITRLVRDKLEANGVWVIMTRDGDTYPTLTERPDLANSKDAALFVSIHVNSATTEQANGIEVYYAETNNHEYYNVSSQEVAKSVLSELINQTGARNRGVKTAQHAVTRRSIMPAILVETGFISNDAEIQKLVDSTYQNKLAAGIAKGILNNLWKINVPDRRELVEKLVAEEVGAAAAKEYMNEVWK